MTEHPAGDLATLHDELAHTIRANRRRCPACGCPGPSRSDSDQARAVIAFLRDRWGAGEIARLERDQRTGQLIEEDR